MDESIALILSVAFIGGALASGFPGWQGEIILSGIGIVAIGVMPYLWPKGLARWAWGLVTIVAVFSCFYVTLREPQPGANDISRQAPVMGATVTGKVLDPPRLTRSGRARFTLETETITKDKEGKPQTIKGSLYTTTSINQVTGIRPGQTVTVKGNLYKPSPPKNPKQFDFRLYLERQGMFAGISGRTLEPAPEKPPWGVWWIRDRMTKAHVMGAGMPEGALLSSLVIGSRAVDLPIDVKDSFSRVGLAHALSASGFHVSMVLAFVLVLVHNASPRNQFIVGTAALLGYLMLTGVNPAVLRAVVMGIGLLLGKFTDRKSRPVTGLSLAAVLLLIINPGWIWDLGFQFSFLATLGLLVSVGPITEQTLAGLPELLATSIAVPQAAFIWTLPLQLYAIGGFSAYSILANILTSPIFVLLIFGGIVSGILGVAIVPLGAVGAWFIKPIAFLVLLITNTIGELPGNFRNTGTIDLWQLILSYGLIFAVWLLPWWHRQQQFQGNSFPRWIIAAVAINGILFIPQTFERSKALQVTILESGRAPVMIIQSQGTNVLINTGNKSQASFNLLGLFQKEGISRINWAIATQTQTDISEGWNLLLESGVKIDKFTDSKGLIIPQSYQQLTRDLTSAGITPQALGAVKNLEIDKNVQIEVIQPTPPVLKIKIRDGEWLFIGDMDIKQQLQLLQRQATLKTTTLWWSGGELLPELLKAVEPKIAIASSLNLPAPLQTLLEGKGITVFCTGRDGAIAWNPETNVLPLRDGEDGNSAL